MSLERRCDVCGKVIDFESEFYFLRMHIQHPNRSAKVVSEMFEICTDCFNALGSSAKIDHMFATTISENVKEYVSDPSKPVYRG